MHMEPLRCYVGDIISVMQAARPYLYAFIGVIVGLIAGAFLGDTLSPAPGNSLIIFGVPIFCSALLGYLLYAIGRRMSKAEEQSEKSGGYFSLANRIGVAVLIVPAVVSIGAAFIFNDLANNALLSTAVGWLGIILGAWVGVAYVAKDNFKSFHRPEKVATWVTGLFFLLYVIFDGISLLLPQEGAFFGGYINEILNLIVIFGAVYFFSNRGIPSTSPTFV